MSNFLSTETSPYLLQHASNPVDWYPWGDVALEAARAQERPIFLSIGYSACHWCHVMEHESFENTQIAELMNRHFINIKVDREERPDLDQIYMNAVMALTGRGGWPMSVFLTPDLKPFYGGTYWPPTSRMGMPGFGDILQKVNEAWSNSRDHVFQSADELTEHVIAMGVPQGEPGTIAEPQLIAAMQQLLKTADRTNGGFGGAPKFPHPMDIRLLLRCWKRFGSDDALAVVNLTLDKMSRGGIYDHLGGGFHRYSVDERWLAPHFEKMLYDNALLAMAYLDAFQATSNPDYERVVRETLDYILREMTQPEGGFYSTQDADSEGEEGKFFVWSERELCDQLEPEDERVFGTCYDVSAGGNWEGHNILNRVKTHAEAAAALKLDEDELSGLLDRCRQKLFDVRKQRIAPARDDKVLVSWNGLMISAMARAAQILDEPKYADAARDAADFILQQMRDDEGRLLHAFKDGRARFNAYLDDYACLIDGLIDLYQATFETRHLDEALALSERMIARFHDADTGGFFYTSADHEQLVARNKDSQDNATPSGNGMAATALLRLGRLCGRSDLEDVAVGTLEMLAAQLAQYPTSAGQSLIAADFLLGPTHEVVIVEGNSPAETEDLLRPIRQLFLPNALLLLRPAGASDNDLPAAVKPLLAGKTTQTGTATVYICERGTCQAPLTDVKDIQSAFEGS
ncbi:MAG: thioredoxin domain-containing protein [Planctomycetaceae bacterium]|jgi:uncharacterized protein|nr:thioredoxin domain-containing protein [Planctomycetaceae bacterium]MBT6487486.1 thioredoxin domain-containing protein [Planctomycetaceae bacterium]MBT6495081.1 thioredoxin domain-containing protein [Planctomycetaceae bacterium]